MIKIDTGIDFIQPEFLSILFFQQKNLVVYPYVDLKHLHGLENFTVGYNIIDLESTALYNIKEIIEFEANNSYSQNKTLFFIYGLDKSKVQEIMDIKGIRCVLNTNDDVKKLSDGNEEFVFYKTRGMEIGTNMASRDRIGSFLVKAETKKQLMDKVRAAVERLEVYNIQGDAIMRKDIFQDIDMR